MADASTLKVNIKGPSELKLSLDISSDQTVLQLKEAIAQQKPDIPADAQRLIYAGKVLKDEELLSTYKIKDGNTIHMVKSAARSAPTTGNPSAAGTAPSNNSTAAGGGASAASSQAQGVPTNFSAGQTFTNNPLSALNRADYAGPHMARLLNESGGAFGGMGMNPRDPNMMLGLMQNPEVQRQMRDMMSRPEFVDQMIALNPQMQAMAPQMREMMRSEQFRDMLTNPETMQRMAQMQQMMGGAGMGGMEGFGGLGGAGAGTAGANTGAGQWPPAGAFGTPATDSTNATAPGNGASGAQGNPMANPGMLGSLFGGMGGNAAPSPGGTGGNAGANPFGDPAFLQQLMGGAGGAGGMFGGAGGAPRDTRPPEERFATQLEQMQAMGFYDGQANVRALLMSGGSVEGAMGILFDNPNPTNPTP